MSKVVKTFSSEREMHNWLADANNVEKLKKEYPPPKYTADLDLINKQVKVTKT